MEERVTEKLPETSQLGGCSSEGSSYPESERAYFRRRYGSDYLHQLKDNHQKEAILSTYCKPVRRAEIHKIVNQNEHLECSNDPKMERPGRSAYSLKQLKENLSLYVQPQARSLRWNRWYRRALAKVAAQVYDVCRGLTPIGFQDVAESAELLRNLDKNAGYLVFETGLRSKGENLQEALEWWKANEKLVRNAGRYNIPLVISHRSSNSKPIDDRHWKWRCRIILMQDLRAQLADGRYLIPFTRAFKKVPWGEGSMTQEEVENWVADVRYRYTHFYSSDYSKFDTSQAAWLLEDVFYHIVRPCFGQLSPDDEQMFSIMVESYIHKDIHGFDGVYHADGCQISGSLATYAINTIVNQVVDYTALLAQGCNLDHFVSLKCGDDNLTYYRAEPNWDPKRHCLYIWRYFGIKTKIEEGDYGLSSVDPKFLSRVWTYDGAERDIREVLFNLIYPERYRDYRPEKTHVSEKRAVALVLACAVHEQPKTMRQYFDVEAIMRDAGVTRKNSIATYEAVAQLGTGFVTPWLNFKFGNLKQNPLLSA